MTKSLANSQQVTGKQQIVLPVQHVAIIMDGNRRWADLRGLPRFLGHKEGVKSLRRIVQYAGQLGLKYLTVYAFSSENWQRSREEVNYLFDLFGKVLSEELSELHENKVRLTFLGKMENIPKGLSRSFQEAAQVTKSNSGLSLQVAINYGSRLEITDVVKRIALEVSSGELSIDAIDDNLVSSYLYTGGLPDPELIVRTGGQMRLSNYLLWQAAYSELYVTSTLWPDFSPSHFDQAINEFIQRERRYGGD